MVNEGKDVTIVATGHLVWEAIKPGEILEAEGIDAEIINIHNIKPLDSEAILKSIKKTGCIVTAEEHNRLGGLGDSVAQVLTTEYYSSRICCGQQQFRRKRNTSRVDGQIRLECGSNCKSCEESYF